MTSLVSCSLTVCFCGCCVISETDDFCGHISQANIYASPAGENADKLLQFKRWFWSIVEKMSMTERQDLVSYCLLHYFLSIHVVKQTD